VKDMEKQEKVEIVLGISIMYLIITSIFSILSRIGSYLFIGANVKHSIQIFFNRNALWIIVVVIVIAGLASYMKKTGLKVSFKIMNNSVVRITTGLLITITGFVNLATTLPVTYASINSVVITLRLGGSIPGNNAERAIISNVIVIILLLGQIVYGIYLIKYYKPKEII
jgi:hypothetical protein